MIWGGMSEIELERFRRAFQERVRDLPRVLPVPRHVCYSRRMSNDMSEIIKAKSEAISALEDALNKAIKNGWVGSAGQAASFVSTWAEAVKAMVPIEPETPTLIAPPKTMFSANSSDATHYREDFSGPLTACKRDVHEPANLLYTDDAADVTCLTCSDILS